MALDDKDAIWTFISWGRPFKLVTSLLDCSSPDTTPIQVECGWGYSCALTASGTVLVWWPLGEAIQQRFTIKMHEMDTARNTQAHATREGEIPCSCWDLDFDPLHVPPLPELPNIRGDDESGEVKLVKVAAMDGFLIGLTNKGHVLKFGDLSNELTLQHGRWEYVGYVHRRYRLD